MSFCKNCGAEVDGKFCSECGEKIDNTTPQNESSTISEEEIQRFERIRLYEIEKCELDIDKIKQEIADLNSKFLVSKKKVTEKEEELQELQDRQRRLSHQTGYDLYIESTKTKTFTDKLKAIDTEKIGNAISTIGNFIPTPVARGAVKSTGKLIKSIKKK